MDSKDCISYEKLNNNNISNNNQFQNFTCNSDLSQDKPEIKEITDIDILEQKFDRLESEIKATTFKQYLSLKKIFLKADIHIKNMFIQYLTFFKIQFLNSLTMKTHEMIENRKLDEEIIKLREENKKLQQNNHKMEEDYNEKIKQEKEKINKNKIDSRIELGQLREKNIKLNNDIIYLKKQLKEKEDNIREFLEEREKHKKLNYNESEVFSISYPLWNPNDRKVTAENQDSQENIIRRLEEKIKTLNNNFYLFSKKLAETCNKGIENFKNIYKEIKGEEWINPYNALVTHHINQVFNIDEKLSLSVISQQLDAINEILRCTNDLINPLKSIKPKELNEESCKFLLSYIIGLRKLFFVQKEILEIPFTNDKDTSNDFRQRLLKLDKRNTDAKNFFLNYSETLNKEEIYKKFKDCLTDEKTQKLSVNEYLKEITSVLKLADKIREKKEKEFLTQKNLINNIDINNNLIMS